MSQFGGGGKPGWGRPGQAAQLPNFVSSLGMMGVGVPMINQAAFSQPGMLSVGMMPAAAVAQQQRTVQNTSNIANANVPVAGKNRTFVGVVTKMHDSYGFVDDDVFFQHTVIRGQHPRVGEKVMVEASFNPQMPFKWNAYRIQLLTGSGVPADNAGAPVQRNSSPSPQRQHSGGSRWGPSSDRHPNNKPASPARRRSPGRRSPPRRGSPPRGSRKRSPIPSRRSPPASRRASPPTSRKRDRSPAVSTTSSVKRDSASPPRRRARIIPRYEFRQPRPVVKRCISLIQLKHRYNKLYIPSDFVELVPKWSDTLPFDASVDLTNPVTFHILNKEISDPNEEKYPKLQKEDLDVRYQVKVLLLAHEGKQEVVKKSYGLLPDGSTDDNHEVTSIFKQLQFLVGNRGKELMAIGGCWSPSLDGPDPTDPKTQIKTAIRTTLEQTGVDLSGVSQWYSLLELFYFRQDRRRPDRVLLLWPDTQQLMPSAEAWETVNGQLRQQLEAKLAAVDALTVEAPPPTPITDVKDSEETKPKEEEGDDTDEAPLPEKPKPKPTHWNDLDVKVMKVAELKMELEARRLETRGIKTLLATRLQEALDKEQELEEDGPQEEPPLQVKEEKEEVMEIDSTPAEVEAATTEPIKTEAEVKKETEEYQKKIEALEKEKVEKKAALEKHFTLPSESKVLVYPSKTAKGGKFECKVVSLQSLLDYRHDDNKESNFEVYLFAEAFKELLERNAAFAIYRNLIEAGDREPERLRREQAAIKPKEAVNGEVIEGEKSSEEKKEEKVEKIELRGIVSNRALFEACAMFDANLCGYFHDRDVEELLLSSDFAVPRSVVHKVLRKVCGRADRFTYRHLTDNLVDSDGNIRFEPKRETNSTELETISRGFGANFEPFIHEKTNGTTASADDGIVIINGNAINVTQKLELLKKSEIERDAAKAALDEQSSLLVQLRESKGDTEKKRKELEKELERTKKKLSEATSTLKTAQDDVTYLKTAIIDCRRYSDRIAIIADKACPPPKKEEKDKEKKSEEKSKESSTEEGKREEKTEDDINAMNLVLSDEALTNELVEVDASEIHPTEAKETIETEE